MLTSQMRKPRHGGVHGAQAARWEASRTARTFPGSDSSGAWASPLCPSLLGMTWSVNRWQRRPLGAKGCARGWRLVKKAGTPKELSSEFILILSLKLIEYL